jgi:hypothetical protein
MAALPKIGGNNMKHFILSCLMLVLFSGFILSQTGSTISIYSRPSESLVWIDSVSVGKTPLENYKIAPGQHHIIVSPPQSGIWNFEDKSYDVIIEENEDKSITATFFKPVYINSIPYGAHLKSEEKHIGITPIYLPFEINRDKSFKLIKEGYQAYEFTLKRANPILAKLLKEEEKAEQSTPELYGMAKKKHTKTKFVLLATTVAAHWASFYFKNKADDEFEKYLLTAEPGQMDTFLSNTQRYDRFSEIALGVSFASLAGLIYMVVWH